MQGGVVMTLYPPGSKFLNMKRISEPEQYNVSRDVPGRINSIVNIHNPSIEIHTVDRTAYTGTLDRAAMNPSVVPPKTMRAASHL